MSIEIALLIGWIIETIVYLICRADWEDCTLWQLPSQSGEEEMIVYLLLMPVHILGTLLLALFLFVLFDYFPFLHP